MIKCTEVTLEIETSMDIDYAAGADVEKEVLSQFSPVSTLLVISVAQSV